MSAVTISRERLLAYGAATALLAAALGVGIARYGTPDPQLPTQSAKKISYWYDPMVPAEHHDGPGLSSMGMKLIPKYADSGSSAAPGVAVDAAGMQRLGSRIVVVRRGVLLQAATATGTIGFDERQVAIVQARSGAFVRRVFARAPGDIIAAGAPLAEVLVPEWSGARIEYDAVRRTGDAALMRAARQRMALVGMDGSATGSTTIRSPIGGVIKTLGIRQGMTLAAGQTLAEVNGISSVWLNAAVPEASAANIRIGQIAKATLSGWPGETFIGRVSAVLPQAEAASRTLTVRVVLANRGGRLRPGMLANVQFEQAGRESLLVPSEAVIRTGTRTLVMLAQPGGRYRPAEVQTGAEGGGNTEIMAGLAEGEKVVASGQFLLDSEAGLAGIEARPIGGEQPLAAQSPTIRRNERVVGR